MLVPLVSIDIHRHLVIYDGAPIMVSYRTLIFGTIAVISASAPAVAGGLSPLPGPQQAVVSPGGLTPLPAQTKPGQKQTNENVVTVVLERLGQLERQILQLHL